MGILLGLLGIALFVFWVASLILPWRLRGRVEALEREVARLKTGAKDAPPAEDFGPAFATGRKAPWGDPAPQKPAMDFAPKRAAAPTMAAAETAARPSVFDDFDEREEKPAHGFEIQFGKRLPVWFGGIALALAGFYLVKYSIDIGLLTAGVRDAIGMAFGIALLEAGRWVRQRPGIANGARIAQALSGAGIADLYGCIFAAVSLHDLVPAPAGFAGMALVTATALVLSARHGAPVALLGLAGGFLTPVMIKAGGVQLPLLFSYLYLLVAGVLFVARRQGWAWLGLAAVGGAFLWVACSLIGGRAVAGGIWTGFFLFSVALTAAVAMRGTAKGGEHAGNAAMGVAVVLMGFTVGSYGYGMTEWALYGLLSLAAIGMAWLDEKSFRYMPLAALAVNIAMIASWRGALPGDKGLVILGFAALFSGAGYLLQRRGREAAAWAGIAAGGGLAYYLLGWWMLGSKLPWLAEAHGWGLAALAGASLCVAETVRLVRARANDAVLAVYAGAATAFLSLGIAMEMQRDMLPAAFAAEVCALGWISARVHIESLRKYAAMLAGIFACLILPQILTLAGVAVYALLEIKVNTLNAAPFVQWPLLQLGLPALFFWGAARLFLRQRDGRVVRAFEVAGILLAAGAAYYLGRGLLHPGENVLYVKAGFFERGIVTNALFLMGLGFIALGRGLSRRAAALAGAGLALAAAFRVFWFDLALHNPLWDGTQKVGAALLVNALPLAYGLPLVWMQRLARDAKALGLAWAAPLLKGLMLASAFALVSLEVRQYFHGTALAHGDTTVAEIYAYSAAWLLAGLGLLFMGTLKKDKLMRVASLALMIVTVGKVFLFDAAALTGLYRVFSFLGLGLALIGISWFYSKFVFPKTEQ